MNLVRLALRLAIGSDRSDRQRSVTVAIAAAIGVMVALSGLAFVHADLSVNPVRYESGDLGRAVLVVAVVVGLQIVALIAAAGRLSAVVRARRLANLRLLGLSVLRTRLVSAIEVGVFAGIGALLGGIAFVAMRPLLARVTVAGERWPLAELTPGWLWGLMIIATTVAVTIALAALPGRLDSSAARAQVRAVPVRAPSTWRLVPLVVGFALCIHVERTADRGMPMAEFLVGVVTLGIGIMVVMPAFTGFVGVALGRVVRGSVGLVTSRRLLAQPASMNRIVAGLLVGLFVVTGARCVVSAFEDTIQYRGAAIGVVDHQTVMVNEDNMDDAEVAHIASAVEGVRSVVMVPRPVVAGCGDERCPDVIAVGCEEFTAMVPSASGCIEGRAQWIVPTGTYSQPSDVTRVDGVTLLAEGGDNVALTVTDSTLHVDVFEPVGCSFCIRLPPDESDIAALLPGAPRTVVVTGDPGRDLPQRLRSVGLGSAFAPWDAEEYDHVAAIRAFANALSGVVLGLGLAAFAIAAIDHANNRRRDVTSLLLIGTPRSLLRRSQWIESAIPIVAGSILAVTSGALAGAAYLAGGSAGDGKGPPLSAIGPLCLGALLGGVLIASLTVIASSQTLERDSIRRE